MLKEALIAQGTPNKSPQKQSVATGGGQAELTSGAAGRQLS